MALQWPRVIFEAKRVQATFEGFVESASMRRQTSNESLNATRESSGSLDWTPWWGLANARSRVGGCLEGGAESAVTMLLSFPFTPITSFQVVAHERGTGGQDLIVRHQCVKRSCIELGSVLVVLCGATPIVWPLVGHVLIICPP